MATEMASISDEPAENGEKKESLRAAGGSGGWANVVWQLAKKAAVAGAAMASAPIVIPPYCVASTLGLALSLPFCVYLATIAATEKAMASLLSPAPENQTDEAELGYWNSIVEIIPSSEGEFTASLSEQVSAIDASSETETVVEPPIAVSTEPASAMTETRTYEKVEEKRKDAIWKEISALRTIMGYRAALQPSTLEELRALYVFIGIEPPFSLKDSSAMEIMDKLQFLKFLLGVN
ncbi:uncharacterized protein LOC122024344 [Zingiber officinale]|uniref:Uncharacterized protein n=1 Tax=Zingiber officinale TaxID=94328 RepID=A0A8J5KBL5_ZINOF|nr:uncharacterized protein LOC122024344 [Zingiber officinale]KAG6476431.1 hypothetical protein ZIOFF_065672 [Zingiber officinale]